MATPKRIMIYGVTGSGKTTLAQKLSDLYGIPWHAIDDLTHEPGWIDVEAEEQRRRISAICVQDEWIIDHGYARWLDLVMARADLIVCLDYPRSVSLLRLLKRTISRCVDGKLVCNGNRETFRLMLSRQSIILWHFASFKRKRSRMRAWLRECPGPEILLHRSPRETTAWLARLRAELPRTAECSLPVK